MKSRSAAPILVPPAQSGAASPALASIVSGDAAARKGVSRVSRVANVNTSVRGRVASRDGPEKPDPPPPAAPDDRAATYISCRIARA